jgi:hypothetical protein
VSTAPATTPPPATPSPPPPKPLQCYCMVHVLGQRVVLEEWHCDTRLWLRLKPL